MSFANALFGASNNLLKGATYATDVLAGKYAVQPTGNVDTGAPAPAPTGGGTSYAAAPAAPAPPAYDPNQVAAYDQAIGTTNAALGRLPNQLGIADANVNDEFGVKNNELISAKADANHQYDTGTTQNGQSYVTNKNTITDHASQGLHSLLRLLGAHGAGGSSDYLYSAPQAVAHDASQQRSGAGQTFGQNQISLDTNWNSFQAKDKNSHDQLNDWGTQQHNQAHIQSEQSKQSLLQQLADLSSKKAAYMGGNGVTASQPYLDQVNNSANLVDNLGRFHPTYSGVTPVYTAPELSTYTVQSAGGPQIAQNPNSSQNSPLLSLLLGGNKKDQNQLQPTF